MKLTDIIGWIGTLLILVAYGLLSTGLIASDIRYYIPMLIGSTGVAIISYVKKAWQPCVLNIIFAILSIVAIVKGLL